MNASDPFLSHAARDGCPLQGAPVARAGYPAIEDYRVVMKNLNRRYEKKHGKKTKLVLDAKAMKDLARALDATEPPPALRKLLSKRKRLSS